MEDIEEQIQSPLIPPQEINQKIQIYLNTKDNLYTEQKMEPSYSFLLRTDLSRYVGKWVAIVDERVVATDVNAKRAYEKAKSISPDKEPLLDRVYGDKTMIV